MADKTFAFIADSYVFYIFFVPENTLFAKQFENFNNPYSIIKVTEKIDVRTGWTLEDGKLVNSKNLVEYDDPNPDIETTRYAFVSDSDKEVFFTLYVANDTALGKTFDAAYNSGITVVETTGSKNLVVGSKLVDGNFIPPEAE